MEKASTNIPQPEVNKEHLQNFIDRDGGLYDQAIDVDPRETFEAQRRSQNEAYKTYSENIKVSKESEREEKIERFKALSKRAALKLGGTALIAPFATEFIQRVNANRQMREAYIADRPHKTIYDRIESEKSAFTGSIDDFKRLNQKIAQRKEKDRVERQQKRQNFFS